MWRAWHSRTWAGRKPLRNDGTGPGLTGDASVGTGWRQAFIPPGRMDLSGRLDATLTGIAPVGSDVLVLRSWLKTPLITSRPPLMFHARLSDDESVTRMREGWPGRPRRCHARLIQKADRGRPPERPRALTWAQREMSSPITPAAPAQSAAVRCAPAQRLPNSARPVCKMPRESQSEDAGRCRSAACDVPPGRPAWLVGQQLLDDRPLEIGDFVARPPRQGSSQSLGSPRLTPPPRYHFVNWSNAPERPRRSRTIRAAASRATSPRACRLLSDKTVCPPDYAARRSRYPST